MLYIKKCMCVRMCIYAQFSEIQSYYSSSSIEIELLAYVTHFHPLRKGLAT